MLGSVILDSKNIFINFRYLVDVPSVAIFGAVTFDLKTQ